MRRERCADLVLGSGLGLVPVGALDHQLLQPHDLAEVGLGKLAVNRSEGLAFRVRLEAHSERSLPRHPRSHRLHTHDTARLGRAGGTGSVHARCAQYRGSQQTKFSVRAWPGPQW